jgi:hypothetical protein
MCLWDMYSFFQSQQAAAFFWAHEHLMCQHVSKVEVHLISIKRLVRISDAERNAHENVAASDPIAVIENTSRTSVKSTRRPRRRHQQSCRPCRA